MHVAIICKEKCNKINYYIDSSVLSNVPFEINFDNSHCEINSVIKSWTFARQNITTLKSIRRSQRIIEDLYIMNRIIGWLSRITKI